MRLLVCNLATDCDDAVLGFATLWIEELAKHADAIDVLTMRAGRTKFPEHVYVYSVGKEKGYSEARRALEFYRILWTLLRRHRYDAFFAHMMPLFAVMAAPFLKVRKIPIVLWYAHKSVTMMLRVATALADRVVTSTPEGFRIRTSKVRVIGQGIATDLFAPLNDDASETGAFHIVSVGRLSRVKRVDLLIQAVALCRNKAPDISFRVSIVGGPITEKDEGYMEELRQQVEQEQLADTVFFEGSVSFEHALSYYQRADCFVNVSQTGSADKAVLEAMSCAIPVIVNPVFAGILGPELARTWVIDWDAHMLADRILRLVGMSDSQRQELGYVLRDIVVREHGLTRLCQKIFVEIEALREQ